MQVSKKKINEKLLKQVKQMWYQLVVDIKTPEEAAEVLTGLLSETELTAITKRLAVAYWLTKGRSYENIRDNLKVSSATIAAVQQVLGTPGWKHAIKKVTADEWATKWEGKIKSILKIGETS